MHSMVAFGLAQRLLVILFGPHRGREKRHHAELLAPQKQQHASPIIEGQYLSATVKNMAVAVNEPDVTSI